eukprot:375270-Pelagomonas_calceolata.AAC.3
MHLSAKDKHAWSLSVLKSAKAPGAWINWDILGQTFNGQWHATYDGLRMSQLCKWNTRMLRSQAYRLKQQVCTTTIQGTEQELWLSKDKC